MSVSHSTEPRHRNLHYIEWLRVAIIALVVAHHAGQAYGPTGGEWPVTETVSSPFLGPFFAVNAGFFMGLFFLVSGYFTGGSHDRRGSARFAKDRLIRLGVPVAFVSLFVFGPAFYFSAPSETSFWHYWLWDYVGEWNVEMGHLWFVAHLLVYSLLYALWRRLPFAGDSSDRAKTRVPGHLTFLGFAVFLGLVGAAVRARFQQDYWVDIFWLVPAELVHLPQYLSLFFIGVLAGRGEWFQRVATPVGYVWLGIGLSCAIFAYAVMLGLFPNLMASDHAFIYFAVWEAFLCTGLSVGLIVVFREHANAPGRLLRFLAPSVYSVYIIHVFVVIGLQMLMFPLHLGALAKFIIVTGLGIGLSFLIAYPLRRLPGLRQIL
jgi:peptidoglycan/LPS O-acetylase OafA/YrhL